MEESIISKAPDGAPRLTGYGDWNRWFQFIMYYAGSYNVTQSVDPDGPDMMHEVLEPRQFTTREVVAQIKFDRSRFWAVSDLLRAQDAREKSNREGRETGENGQDEPNKTTPSSSTSSTKSTEPLSQHEYDRAIKALEAKHDQWMLLFREHRTNVRKIEMLIANTVDPSLLASARLQTGTSTPSTRVLIRALRDISSSIGYDFQTRRITGCDDGLTPARLQDQSFAE